MKMKRVVEKPNKDPKLLCKLPVYFYLTNIDRSVATNMTTNILQKVQWIPCPQQKGAMQTDFE